jgi:hypothetical protein
MANTPRNFTMSSTPLNFTTLKGVFKRIWYLQELAIARTEGRPDPPSYGSEDLRQPCLVGEKLRREK